MRIPVKVDEVRCNRCGEEMEDRVTDPKAAALYAAATGIDAKDVDLKAACEKRVLALGEQIATPRKRVKASPK